MLVAATLVLFLPKTAGIRAAMKAQTSS